MKNLTYIFLKKITQFIFSLSQRSITLRRILDILGECNSQNVKKIQLKNNVMFLHEVNSVTKYRNDTFFNKEPETLEWIDKFAKNSVFWDVGANVGLYSIYAAKIKNCNVTAIEPSVFNLELLAKNIYLNSLNNKINILPLGLSEKTSVTNFHNTSILNGAALSSLEISNIRPINQPPNQCDYKIPVITLNSINSIFKIPNPEHLKIDVDGLEYEILLGAKSVLKNLKSILIEIDECDKKKSKHIISLLKKQNFELVKEGQRFSDVSTVNQIWSKL